MQIKILKFTFSLLSGFYKIKPLKIIFVNEWFNMGRERIGGEEISIIKSM